MRITEMKFLTLTLLAIIWMSVSKPNVSAQVKKPATTKKVEAKPAITPKSAKTESLDRFMGKPRFALVIGNNSYQLKPLNNPISDASKIAGSLRSLGFNVTEKKDLTLAGMREAVETFSRQLPAEAVAVFYFAGHGIQISGRNFLLPIDFTYVDTPGEFKEKEFLATQLDLDTVISGISKKSGLAIIILDACRNNGYKGAFSFQVEEGFAAPKQTSGGIYIAYSTSPGTEASDGNDGNSPYSKALAKNLLLSPGRLEDIFIKTRIEVRNETALYLKDEQIPWENGSLSTVFYFTPDKLRPSGIASSGNPVTASIPIKPKLPADIVKLLKFSSIVPFIDRSGTFIESTEKAGMYFVESAGATNLEMVEIAGGKFQMGSSFEEVENAYQDALQSNNKADRTLITTEMPRRLVNVPGFFMSKYEITQGQWQAVMGSLPPEIPNNLRGNDKPVVNVTWDEANRFCNALSLKTGRKRNYRLPSEAEWEYAARGGTETPFATGENINSEYVNFFALVPFGEGSKGEFREKTVAVGELNAPNNFGLHEMQGNVSEWVADYWHWDYNGAPNDGKAWNKPEKKADDDAEDPALYRVVRGCSYQSIGNYCRSARRAAKPAVDDFRDLELGFRIVVSN